MSYSIKHSKCCRYNNIKDNLKNCFRLIDNLPVATRILNTETSEKTIEQGYRLGFMRKGRAYIHNHLKLLLKYHKHNQ